MVAVQITGMAGAQAKRVSQRRQEERAGTGGDAKTINPSASTTSSRTTSAA